MIDTLSPLFTIVIPVYNRAHLIERAVKSVLEQTISCLEVIVIDDGSNDQPDLVINKICDNRVVYIRQDNKGAAAARNHGVRVAKGRYVAFLDSDDIWLNNHLEQSLPLVSSGNNVCVYGAVTVDRGKGISFIKPPRGMKAGEHISEYLLCDRGFFPTCSIVLPTKLAISALYDEEVIYGDDVDFALKICAQGGDFRFLKSTPPTAIWMDHPSPERQSASIDPELIQKWLSKVDCLLTDKAKIGCMGWTAARGYASKGEWGTAIKLYARAVLKGCYSPKMAIVILLQILMPRNVYRNMSDYIAQFGFNP